MTYLNILEFTFIYKTDNIYQTDWISNNLQYLWQCNAEELNQTLIFFNHYYKLFKY